MKYFLFLAIACFSLILAGCKANFNNDLKAVTLGGSKFNLEVAETSDELETGLMDRKQLGKDSGMLFVFEKKEVQDFWMKNTLIPLQIIFIDGCKIVDIQEMAVEKNPANPVNHYTSKSPADKAVELNSESVPNDLRQTIQELCD